MSKIYSRKCDDSAKKQEEMEIVFSYFHLGNIIYQYIIPLHYSRI